jgi:3-oxoacyl-[acyl-carrier-protein] synthase III
MRFEHVSIVDLHHVEAPVRVPSTDIEARLAETMARIGMRPDVLRTVAGIEARRYFEPGVQPSDAATRAAEGLLAKVDVPREKIGVIFNTSVCRDFIEPSTACLVHGNLGLSPHCLNFDLGNACLAFINAMELAGALIERGAVGYALVVDGENSRHVVENTIARLQGPEVTAEMFRDQFAALTLGSGGVAMLLARSDLAPHGHAFRGAVSLAATEHRRLCHGQPDLMVTDTRALLVEGVKLAARTFAMAKESFGWGPDALQHHHIHQVSRVHTDQLTRTLGIEVAEADLIFPEHGNIGPASVPTVLARAAAEGRLQPGERIGLLAIGSGLNCSMAEIEW